MTTTQTSRLEGLTTALSYKAPCKVATTANVTLSGLQTIDGVTLVEDDRVLVKDQTTGSENGIYLATSSAWTRAKDWNGARDAQKGTQVRVTDGSANGGKNFYVTTDNPITIGTTSISFGVDATGAFDSISPMNSLGDIIYGGASGTGTALDGNTTTTRKFLRQVGDGADSAAPAWDTLTSGDMPSDVLLDGDLNSAGLVYTDGAGTYSEIAITAGSNITVSGGSGSDYTITGGAGGGSNDFDDDVFRISDADDSTRKIAFDAGTVSAGSVRTLSAPNQNDTIVGETATQTLTNKTLTSPIISTISNTGALTLPTSTDTLVGRATTDTLTNKTLTSPTISQIENSGTLTLPTGADTIASGSNTLTMSNKTLTSPVINTGVSGTAIKDEDDMVSDSATHLATQQSIKAYVDATAGGETNTMSNSGGGAGVYKTKTGVDFELNDVVAGSNITVAGGGAGGGDITITGGAGGGETNTASNVGSGSGVFKQKSGADLEFKSITAGSNITVSGGTNDITITGGAGGSGDLWSDAVDADIVPDADSTRDLGSSANRFAESYVDDRRGEFGAITQTSATEYLDTVKPTYNLTLDNPAFTISSYDTSNDSSTVHYGLFTHTEKVSGDTDAGAIGGEIETGGSNVDIWGATFNASALSGHDNCDLHGIEMAVRDFGGSNNNTFGIVVVAMGNNNISAGMQFNPNVGGGGTAARFAKGIVFNNVDNTSTARNVVTESYLYSNAGSPTYGIDFQSCPFGTAAINIENCNTTYGVRTTGTQTIGFEHGGTGATAGFRAQGGGTSAFKVSTGTSYTNGLDADGVTFSSGFFLKHTNFSVANTGLTQWGSGVFDGGSFSTLAGHLSVQVGGTTYKIKLYTT
jgi:hypothetical protein